jgi:membrane protein implicated in regulation of membrane protease activity
MLNILAWWNLVFLLPLALGVLLLVASGLTGALDSGHGDAGHADSGHGDAGHADGDGDTSHDLHAEHDTDGYGFGDLLHTLGVGIVPLSLLMPAFLLTFGVLGITANRLLAVESSSGSRFWLALLIALLFGLVGMALLGAAFRKFLPTNERATGNKDLIGKTGKVIFGVSNTEGTIQVRDMTGTLHQLPARVRDGQGDIASGQEVLLVGFDSEHGCFIVEDSPFS